jgi:hypothetical protein
MTATRRIRIKREPNTRVFFIPRKMEEAGPRQAKTTRKERRAKMEGVSRISSKIPTRRNSSDKENDMTVAQLYGKAVHLNTLKEMLEMIERTSHVRKIKNATIKKVMKNFGEE